MSTEMIWETLSTSSAETARLGELLGRLVKGGDAVELIADLGGGKTTFTKGLVAGLGSKDVVSSPTFTLSNIYEASSLQVHHYDFYRLEDAGILKDQLKESLDSPNVVTVVEWSQIVQDVLPAEKLTIKLLPTASNSEERNVSIEYPVSKSALIKKLETAWVRVKP